MNITQAIYKLYPQVVRTSGDEAFDADGNQIQYDLQAVTTQAQKDDCKATAVALLAQTDWTQMPDVSNPALTPHLVNLDEFNAYRASVRALAVNPVPSPVFPTEPTAQWSE